MTVFSHWHILQYLITAIYFQYAVKTPIDEIWRSKCLLCTEQILLLSTTDVRLIFIPVSNLWITFTFFCLSWLSWSIININKKWKWIFITDAYLFFYFLGLLHQLQSLEFAENRQTQGNSSIVISLVADMLQVSRYAVMVNEVNLFDRYYWVVCSVLIRCVQSKIRR